MARKQDGRKQRNDAEIDQLFRDHIHNIIPVDLEQEMKTAFIDYAMSVITDRALPDVRDGLKPVHRRILYTMFTQGFTPDKPYRKCAATVGDVLGRFHPHGDAAVYDALVRLAQDFSMRYMLVDGHGNFGSRDGDAPAAYRYTEARMTKLAVEMMADINKDTVDFQPNFDEHEIEPSVLPTHFPNLLVNGSTGIAVGMATNIPPHNLSEVIDGTILLLENPEANIDELMERIPAPDFPTGGCIMGVSGVREAYRTGRGRVVVRAHADIEEMGSNRYQIVVRDLPYQVNKARLIERIAAHAKEKRVEGISFVRDESDREEAVRVVIELKQGAKPNVVLNQLYRHSSLEESFSCNMLALVPGPGGVMVPKTVNLKETLEYFIAHEKQVVTRRTRFDLDKTEARRHIVQGLLRAIDIIDEVIHLIRHSHTEQEAKEGLQTQFAFSERQAQHIVDMRLGRLTGLERERLLDELAELEQKIERLQRILNDESELVRCLIAEMSELKRRYQDERRTEIDPTAEEVDDESLIPEEDVVITLSHRGYIKRLPLTTYQMQHRGGRGISGMQTQDEDDVAQLLVTSSHDQLLFFTNTGRVFKLKAWQLPVAGRQARGLALVNLLQLNADEKVSNIIPVHDVDDGGYLCFATEQGLVKKTALDDYRNINRTGIIAIKLRDEDRLVAVRRIFDGQDLLLASAAGMSIRFAEAEVRATGRASSGVLGMRLRDGDRVIGMQAIDVSSEFLLISSHGFGKRCGHDLYRKQGRGGYGIRTYGVNDKTGELIALALLKDPQDIILIDDQGVIIRIASEEVPQLGRTARGVTLMRSGACVVDAAVVDRPEAEVEEREEARVQEIAVEDEESTEIAGESSEDLEESET